MSEKRWREGRAEKIARSTNRWREAHPENVARSTRQHRQKHPEKYRARTAVNNALRDGRLVKPDQCERCGTAGALHGHHDDYSKPLEVEWLCRSCHTTEHHEVAK